MPQTKLCSGVSRKGFSEMNRDLNDGREQQAQRPWVGTDLASLKNYKEAGAE